MSNSSCSWFQCYLTVQFNSPVSDSIIMILASFPLHSTAMPTISSWPSATNTKCFSVYVMLSCWAPRFVLFSSVKTLENEMWTAACCWDSQIYITTSLDGGCGFVVSLPSVLTPLFEAYKSKIVRYSLRRCFTLLTFFDLSECGGFAVHSASDSIFL